MEGSRAGAGQASQWRGHTEGMEPGAQGAVSPVSGGGKMGMQGEKEREGNLVPEVQRMPRVPCTQEEDGPGGGRSSLGT